MSSGRPDWHNITDISIIEQTLAELKVRPVYGTLLQEYKREYLESGYSGYFLKITGEGRFYGGSIWLNDAPIHQHDTVTLKVDGQIIQFTTMGDLFARERFSPKQSLLYLYQYDQPNHRIGVGIGPEFTFGSEVRIDYAVDPLYDSATPEVYFLYANVTT